MRAARIYRREPVRAGLWYHAANCQRCGEPIYLFDDPTQGQNPASFAGVGRFVATCPRCTHDNLLDAESVTVIQSVETWPGMRPERVPISKSSRTPITRAFPTATATFGVGYVEDRPKAAAIIGRIITSWSDIEVGCARLLGELLEIHIPAAAAVFGSLRSGRAQHDALDAAALKILDDRDYELFSAYMKHRKSLEKVRNEIAHGCYGVSVAIPDHIVWVAQADYLDFTANFQIGAEAAAAKFRERQFVYELGTLERIAQEIEEFHQHLSFFSGYLSTRHGGEENAERRTHRYSELCNQPHIRRALLEIRAAREKGVRTDPEIT